MTKAELLEVVKQEQTLFPNFCTQANELNAWFYVLNAYDAGEVREAFYNVSLTSKFAPKPNEIIKEVNYIRQRAERDYTTFERVSVYGWLLRNHLEKVDEWLNQFDADEQVKIIEMARARSLSEKREKQKF